MKEKNTAAAAGGGVKRRKYDTSFKQEVLQMVLNGRPVSEVAQSLGIGENILYRWKSSANQQKRSDRLPSSVAGSSHSSGGTPATMTAAEEMLTLHKRIYELEQER